MKLRNANVAASLVVISTILSNCVGIRHAPKRRAIESCVDNESYESKLGMKCADHSVFICEGLITTGLLTAYEFDELIDNCPISCRSSKCEEQLSPVQKARKVVEIDGAEAEHERDLLITFPSQDGDQCFVGWDASCQDDPIYKSPLGGLPCSEYANTQCVLFRHVGFNETQMHDFINSCPCSCGIECGTWTLRPTNMPTASPTMSAKPSIVPTPAPTISSPPSSSPSSAPSSAPTKEACYAGWSNQCQDNEAYISPQGGNCASFSKFDCRSFSAVYSAEDFFNLVTNCPCSCSIECGTYTMAPSPTPSQAPSRSPPVTVSVTGRTFDVRMAPVSSMMDPEAVSVFQSTLITMTLQNLAFSSEVDAQMSLMSHTQSIPSSGELEVNARLGGTFIVPASGPGIPDPAYEPTLQQLDDAVALIFSSQETDFIASLQAAANLNSVQNVTYFNFTS